MVVPTTANRFKTSLNFSSCSLSSIIDVEIANLIDHALEVANLMGKLFLEPVGEVRLAQSDVGYGQRRK